MHEAVVDAFTRFLQAPPKKTPTEIVNAHTAFAIECRQRNDSSDIVDGEVQFALLTGCTLRNGRNPAKWLLHLCSDVVFSPVDLDEYRTVRLGRREHVKSKTTQDRFQTSLGMLDKSDFGGFAAEAMRSYRKLSPSQDWPECVSLIELQHTPIPGQSWDTFKVHGPSRRFCTVSFDEDNSQALVEADFDWGCEEAAEGSKAESCDLLDVCAAAKARRGRRCQEAMTKPLRAPPQPEIPVDLEAELESLLLSPLDMPMFDALQEVLKADEVFDHRDDGESDDVPKAPKVVKKQVKQPQTSEFPEIPTGRAPVRSPKSYLEAPLACHHVTALAVCEEYGVRYSSCPWGVKSLDGRQLGKFHQMWGKTLKATCCLHKGCSLLWDFNDNQER